MLVLLFSMSAALAAPLAAGDAVEAALVRSAQVAGAEADLDAARGRLRAAGPLTDDPSVEGSYALVGERVSVTASQPIPITGAGLAARRSARAEVEAAEARLARARLEVAAEVRLAWAGAVEARQRSLLASEAAELGATLREAAEQRLAAGEASLLDARLARIEAAEALATWMAAVVDEGERTAALAARVGVAVGALELPDDPLQAAPDPIGGAADRSDLAAARHDVDAARAAFSRERASVLPPIGVGGFYEAEGEESWAGPTVSVTIPLWNRNAGGRAEARGELHEASARLAETERAATAERQAAEGVVQRLASGVEEMDVDVLAEARGALEGIALGYDRGELDLHEASELRSVVFDGLQAWLEGRRLLAEARIGLLLAQEDAALVEGR